MARRGWLCLLLPALVLPLGPQGSRGQFPRPTTPQPVDPPVPMVALRVRVPAVSAAGQELTYRLIAENTSSADAHHVLVKAPLPANTTFVSATPAPTDKAPALAWKLGTLKAQARREIKLVVKPKNDDEIALCARVQFEHGQCVRTRIGKPGLQVTQSGPVSAARYDILTYKVDVKNTGQTTIKNVTLRDTLPAGLDFLNSKPSTTGDNPLIWKLGDLAPGRSRQVEFQVVAKETGLLTCKAEAEAGGVKKSAGHTVKVGQPALTLTITGPGHRLVGRDAVYRMTITNPGDMAATNVKLADELTSQIRLIRADASGKQDGDNVRWLLGTIKPGERKAIAVTLRCTQAGTFRNVATVSADRGLLEQARTETKFEKREALFVEIEKAADPVAVDGETTCTLRLINAGQTAEKDISVTVDFGPEVKVLEAKNGAIKDNSVTLTSDAGLGATATLATTIRLRADKVGTAKIKAEVTAKSGTAHAISDSITVVPGGSKINTKSTASRGKILYRAAFKSAE